MTRRGHPPQPRNTMIITNKRHIELYRLLALRGALKLEILGLKHSRGSVYAAVKREFGFKGNKKKVLVLLENYINTTKGTP